MGYIYKITNIKNNKCYIGVTSKKDVNERWAAHKSSIKRGIGCPLLMKAFKKYGENSFKFEVLIICFDEDVFKFENEYIRKYNSSSPNGYNVVQGGKIGMSFLGMKHSEETKKKISEKSKEYNNRPEVKERSRQIAIELNRRINSGEIVRKSEKWHTALKEGRIGNRGGERDNETKNKITKLISDVNNIFIPSETKLNLTSNWDLNYYWIDIAIRWIKGFPIGTICKDYNVYEGNFIRAMLKIANIVDEWATMATISGDLEQLELTKDLRQKIVRDVVIPESLYLRL
jgi:group I intron endonuclease